MRNLALIWLVVVVLAGGYLSFRLYQGLMFSTDLMALLPREERDPALQRANDAIVKSLSQRIVILAGHSDRVQARAAASAIRETLIQSGLVIPDGDEFGIAQMRQMGALYFPYRSGLLSVVDRQYLLNDNGKVIAKRALAQAYGLSGASSAGLLKTDPFLLLPDFFTGLPIPLSRLIPDEGMLSVRDNDRTWVFITLRLRDSPFALTEQKKITNIYDTTVAAQNIVHPGLTILHTGALFFAAAGAQQALHETSLIGLISTVGTVIFLLMIFRSFAPLGLNLLVIGTGVLTALSASLAIFGTLHVGALLFGVSLIGVAVDYGLQYCGEIFMTPAGSPYNRLRRVLPGISIGTATTVIGYLTLLLAPFPGLRQVAAFSAIGLFGAWTTVVLWLPFLDRLRTPKHAIYFLSKADLYLDFWTHGKKRLYIVGPLLLAGILGMFYIHADDDIHHLQSLPAGLMQEQTQIQALVGRSDDNKFFLVQEPDDESALRQEEALSSRLRLLVSEGKLISFQSLADYIPSASRQKENRRLVTTNLYRPLLVKQVADLHLATPPKIPDPQMPVLTPALANAVSPPPVFLSLLSLDNNAAAGVLHIVMLDGIKDPLAVASSAKGLPGIKFIDPAQDFSVLMGKYRIRAFALLLISGGLMAPLLLWRYGPMTGLKVMVPPILAVALTPGLRALCGGAFTFFDAMALVLILAVGVDYAVFYAETGGGRRPVTMLAVAMAAGAALLSFGLLALSNVAAVSAFGGTMLVGISLSFIFAPLVCKDKDQ